MAPFSCFPGGSCGSCGSPSRAGPEEQGKRTAGGWDCELGNGMGLQEAQRSMVGDSELKWGWRKLKEVEGGKVILVKAVGKFLRKKVVGLSQRRMFCSTLFIQSLLNSQNSLIAFVYLENVTFGVAQHQPAAVHVFLHIGLVWLRLHVLQMSKRAFQSLLNGSEPEERTSTRPGWGLLPDVFWDVFLKPMSGDGEVLVTKKKPFFWWALYKWAKCYHYDQKWFETGFLMLPDDVLQGGCSDLKRTLEIRWSLVLTDA